MIVNKSWSQLQSELLTELAAIDWWRDCGDEKTTCTDCGEPAPVNHEGTCEECFAPGFDEQAIEFVKKHARVAYGLTQSQSMML